MYLLDLYRLIDFISSNVIFFSMHSQGILGFPRRIFDYGIIYFKFNRFNSFGLIGISLSIHLFIGSFITPFSIIYIIYFNNRIFLLFIIN
jgi:heme/copper-type cytochrome/quinol oxidase subunit 1